MINKEQTFLAELLDANGREVDFHRYACKRVNTVIKNITKMYSRYSFMAKDLNNTASVVIYSTPLGYGDGELVWSVTVDEFRRMMEAVA
ncbi:MAG: hypothetical protein RR235_09960 [Oscillospiraceae bacterium]